MQLPSFFLDHTETMNFNSSDKFKLCPTGEDLYVFKVIFFLTELLCNIV